MKKSLILILIITLLLLAVGCNKASDNVYDIDIHRIDLSVKPAGISPNFDYLFETVTVDNSKDYLGHPDTILLNNGSILALYPAGHGRGAVLNSVSYDGGLSWENNLIDMPESWEKSEETPTLFRLNFIDGSEKLIMISANPKWPDYKRGDGFNVSILEDDGETWTDFEKFYGKGSKKHISPIVAMSSLIQLKEDGKFVDKWMGIFHDNKFVNYKTILTFSDGGEMEWSKPKAYFSKYRGIERKTRMCEVLMFRSDNGQGNELCLITRSNSKRQNSLISFSQDEGKTWSKPQEVPSSLSGERHKVQFVDDRLFITFRSIERDRERLNQYDKSGKMSHYSEGWVAWIGTYKDLKEGNPGQYRLKLAHTYLEEQTEPDMIASADTGYSGVLMLTDGTLVVTTYGAFGEKTKSQQGYKTYIVSKRIKLEDIDLLAKELNSGKDK